MNFLIYVFALIVTLGVLIIVHELGHYVIARLSGVRILCFKVGFGRPIYSRIDQRGTEWAVALIPLGGYLRMLDSRDEPGHSSAAEAQPGDVSFSALTPGWRIAIALGGPVANFVLAFVVYWVLAMAGSLALAPYMGAPAEDSVLAKNGGEAGQLILRVDGEDVRTWQEVRIALLNRLGETGSISLDVEDYYTKVRRTLTLPIKEWHRGATEPRVLDSLGMSPGATLVLRVVTDDSPASRAGLQVDDRVLAFNGDPLRDWDAFVERISSAPGETVTLDVERAGDVREISVDLAANAPGDTERRGYLGVSPVAPLVEIQYGPFSALGEGLSQTGGTVSLTLGLLRKMVTGEVSVANVSGPITIAQVAGDSARVGWKFYLGVLALLSVSLGILNLLPIPVLDGGHIVFASAELITGKPVSERVQVIGYQLGMFAVASLMILAIYNDVARLIGS